MNGRTVPLKRAATIIAGQSPPSDVVSVLGDAGEPFLQGNAEFGNESPVPKFRCDTASRFAQAGDLLVSIRAPVGAINIADRPYGIGRGLAAVRPNRQLDLRFVWWWMHVAVGALRAEAVGSTYEAVTAEELGALRLPDLSPSQQRAIADFLDSETSRIDALITKKRRMIDLTTERLGALVRNRLARVEPKLPLRRRWAVIDCKHRTPEYLPVGYPVVSPGDVTPGRLDLSRAHRFVGDQDLVDLADDLRRPRRGDIIYSRNASIGVASFVDTDQEFCMGQDVCRLTSSDQDQLYLCYVLNSVGMDQLDMQKIGSTFSRVNVSQILDLEVPTPPPEAQRALALEFDSRALVSNEAVRSLERQIALLQERRQALITAAVTGELDIPEPAR